MRRWLVDRRLASLRQRPARRWLRVERMIEQMMKTGEVWFAPLEEIARHVNACRKKGSYKPRVDRLPYYDKPVGIEVPPLLTRAPASE